MFSNIFLRIFGLSKTIGKGYIDHECSTSTYVSSTKTTFVRDKDPIVVDLSMKGKEPQKDTPRSVQEEFVKTKPNTRNLTIC